MSALFTSRRAAIAAALAGAGEVREARPTEWHVADSIRVRWEDPWLVFDASANGVAEGPPSAWELLRGHGGLPAACRYARDPRGALRVLGEIAREGADDLEARCREIVAGLAAARRGLPPPTATAGTGAAPEPARALAEEIDWSVRERPDGRLVGKLPRGGRYAELAGDGNGARLLVEIAVLPSLSDVARCALGELLLAAGGLVRFARPTIEENDGGSVVRWEARLSARATSAELRHAQAALAVACDATADEVSVLRDELVAKEYLSVRGRPS